MRCSSRHQDGRYRLVVADHAYRVSEEYFGIFEQVAFYLYAANFLHTLNNSVAVAFRSLKAPIFELYAADLFPLILGAVRGSDKAVCIPSRCSQA